MEQTMFEKEVAEYEDLRRAYQEKIAERMGREQRMEYNKILFSAHSCAIEGNSFTVDDTRMLRKQEIYFAKKLRKNGKYKRKIKSLHT